MTERRTFSAEDLAEMRQLAELRNRVAHEIDEREGRVAINKFRPDRVDAHMDGFRGEWAVADSLGVPRPADVSGRADNGTDLTAPRGDTVNVRFTPRRNGKLMCPTNRPMKSRWAVLVIATHDPATVEIVGGVEVADFLDAATRGDVGHGPSLWMTQAQLMPWPPLRHTLTR